MEMLQVAPELRRPMHQVTRLPIPADRAWGRRVTRILLALLPTSKLEGVTIETSKATDASVRVYRPTVRRAPAALFWIHGGGLVIGRATQDDRLCALTARAWDARGVGRVSESARASIPGGPG